MPSEEAGQPAGLSSEEINITVIAQLEGEIKEEVRQQLSLILQVTFIFLFLPTLITLFHL